VHRALTFLRTIVTWVAGAIATVIGATAVVVIALINDTSPLIERVIWGWSRVWLVSSGTKLEVVGREHVDPEKSYVVVANHLSTLDIMACFLAVRIPIRYLAKKELFKVPILAQGMRAVGIIEVDREARSAVHAEVNAERPGTLALIEIHREDIASLPRLLQILRASRRRTCAWLPARARRASSRSTTSRSRGSSTPRCARALPCRRKASLRRASSSTVGSPS